MYDPSRRRAHHALAAFHCERRAASAADHARRDEPSCNVPRVSRSGCGAQVERLRDGSRLERYAGQGHGLVARVLSPGSVRAAAQHDIAPLRAPPQMYALAANLLIRVCSRAADAVKSARLHLKQLLYVHRTIKPAILPCYANARISRRLQADHSKGKLHGVPASEAVHRVRGLRACVRCKRSCKRCSPLFLRVAHRVLKSFFEAGKVLRADLLVAASACHPIGHFFTHGSGKQSPVPNVCCIITGAGACGAGHSACPWPSACPNSCSTT